MQFELKNVPHCQDINSSLTCIYVGTDGHQKKLLSVQVCPISLKPKTVIKKPVGKYAWKSIQNEFKILKFLQSYPEIYAPKPFYLDNHHQCSIQQWIQCKPSPLQLSVDHIKLLHTFLISNSQLFCFDLRDQLYKRVKDSEYHFPQHKNDLRLLGKTLSRCVENFVIPLVLIHGDFAPWNIKRSWLSFVCY